jgi:hypothetical protein
MAKKDHEEIYDPDRQPIQHQAGPGLSFFLYAGHGDVSVRLGTHGVRG